MKWKKTIKLKNIYIIQKKNEINPQDKVNNLGCTINQENKNNSSTENKSIKNSPSLLDSEKNIDNIRKRNDPIYINGDKIKINIDKLKSLKNYKFKSTFFNLIEIDSDANFLYKVYQIL